MKYLQHFFRLEKGIWYVVVLVIWCLSWSNLCYSCSNGVEALEGPSQDQLWVQVFLLQDAWDTSHPGGSGDTVWPSAKHIAMEQGLPYGPWLLVSECPRAVETTHSQGIRPFIFYCAFC